MIKKSKVSKILFVSLTNIGDCIITLPVLSVLRAEFEGARIDYICGPAAVPLFKGAEGLGKVIVYNKKWSLLQKWFWIKELRRERYDLVIDLRHTLIPLLVGARYRTPLIRWKKPEILKVREKNMGHLHRLGLNTKNRNPIRLFGEREQESVSGKLQRRGLKLNEPFALIVPGANSSTKRWTQDGFSNVARFLSGEHQLAIVLTGGAEEKEITKPIEAFCLSSGIKVLNLTGETTLKELAALIVTSQIVIANDSAVTHLASELGAKLVAIYGPTNPWKYAEVSERVKVVRLDLPCSPCEAAQCQIERRKCLDDLSPELVIAAVNELESVIPAPDRCPG